MQYSLFIRGTSAYLTVCTYQIWYKRWSGKFTVYNDHNSGTWFYRFREPRGNDIPNSKRSCASRSWFVIAKRPVILFLTYCTGCQLTVDNQPERPTRRCASVYFVTVGGTCDREAPSLENSALVFFLKGRSYFGIAFSRKEWLEVTQCNVSRVIASPKKPENPRTAKPS